MGNVWEGGEHGNADASSSQTYHLFVAKKCVGQPDFLRHFGAHVQRLDVAQLLERQPRVVPELAEIEVGREVHHDLADRTN